MIIDAFEKQGSSGIRALVDLSLDTVRTQEEVRRCLAVIELDKREFHDVLWARVRRAVRARHPKAGDQIAAEIVSAAFRTLGEGEGERTLQRLVEIGHETELDAEIARVCTSLPAMSSSPIQAPITPSSPTSPGSSNPSSPTSNTLHRAFW
jgi:hypothetical protein